MIAIRIGGILGTLAACAVVGGCQEKAVAPQQIRPVLSMVVSAIKATDAAIVGTVQPQIKTDFSFRTPGLLIARPVNVGDVVEKGRLLAAIDPAAQQLAVRSSLAELSTARAKSVNALETEERKHALLEKSVATKADAETAEQGNAAAQSAVIRAQSNLTKAREQLGNAQLTAEFDGVVTAVGAEVGQVTVPGLTVVTVARSDIREAVIDVAEDLAVGLRIGMPLAVTLQLDRNNSAQGKIREIAPQADPATRTRRVRIILDEPPAAFRLGTTIVTLIPSGPVRGLRLPSTAILTRAGETNVWLVDPSTKVVALQPVQSVPNTDGSVDVFSGLETGARVVTAGVNHLREGQKVRIKQEAAP